MDLWGNISNSSHSAEEVLNILTEQAELLGTKTGGVVRATFKKIKYQSDFTQMEGIVKVVEAISARSEKKEIMDNENLKDAASLYIKEEYKFELYSSKYRYRLFNLEYTPLFPIHLKVEYGILQEKRESLLEISSLESFNDRLGAIFSSKKVRYIIQKMQEAERK